jgi:hypothetical protein
MVFEFGSTAGPVITGAAMDISRDLGFSVILAFGAGVLLAAGLVARGKRRSVAAAGDLCGKS